MDFSKVTNLIDTMPKRGIPFFHLIVTKDGHEVYNHLSGFSDEKLEKPLNRENLYWLFSVSKIATCVCAMQLVEKGLLKLDDPVSKYISSFAHLTIRDENGNAQPCDTVMTVKHLFTMTAGIGPDHESKEVLKDLLEGNADTLSIIRRIAQVPLYFTPGTSYKYSFCHDILAAVVEIVSGIKFSSYVQQNLLSILDMNNTGFRPSKEQETRFCASYQYDNSNGTSKLVPTNNPFLLTEHYDSGGAGLFSCGDDYIKLLTALANGGKAPNGRQILSEKTIEQFEVNHLSKEALREFAGFRLHGYGWGLCGRTHINPDFSLSKSSVGEFGWDGAAGCFAMVDRKNKVAIFYGMQVYNCLYSYIVLEPLIRNLVFEALEK